MFAETGRFSGPAHPGGRCHLRSFAMWSALSGLAAGVTSPPVRADSFARVYYSARTDQLVVVMAYRGTNPGHAFTLKWGPCEE